MTRYAHSVLFFFAIALALLSSAALMLFLNESWSEPSFATLVSAALVLSFVLPAMLAFGSLRFIKWKQPFTAWLIFYLITSVIILILGNLLLS